MDEIVCNGGNFRASFCQTGSIEFTDWQQYRNESYRYMNPKTGLVELKHFKKLLENLSWDQWYTYIQTIGCDSVNVCPMNGQVPIKIPGCTHLYCNHHHGQTCGDQSCSKQD